MQNLKDISLCEISNFPLEQHSPVLSLSELCEYNFIYILSLILTVCPERVWFIAESVFFATSIQYGSINFIKNALSEHTFMQHTFSHKEKNDGK